MTGSLKFINEKPHFLVILMGSIGDVTRGLSVAHQLKAVYPGCRLTWLVEPACKTIVSLNRYIDKVIVYNRSKNIIKNLQAVSELKKELRAEKFDVTFDMQRHFKSGLFSRLSGAPLRIGFHPANSKEFNYLFNNHYIDNLPASEPKLSHYLSFIKKLGREITEPLDFGLTEVKNRPEQTALLKTLPENYICFVMGSSWESKDWYTEGYTKLADKILSQTNYDIVLLGDKTQTAVAAEIEAKFPESKRIYNLAGRTSLTDVVAVADRSSFCLGPDSGPGHICGALGREYISLFGPTDPVLTAPIGNQHLVIKSNLACMPCYRRKCPGLEKACMRLISPEMVYEQAESLLKQHI